MCHANPDPWLATARYKRNTRLPDDIDVVSRAHRSLEAVHLIRLGARANLVCQLTGLGKKTVNALYPRLTGSPSPPGQVPFTDTWYVKGNLRMLHANVVWQLFQHFRGVVDTGAGLVIHVYQTYLQITEAPILSLTRAYFVPRLISISAWCEQSCSHCGLRYVGPIDEGLPICPACAEYFRYRCQSCGAMIERRSPGRRKLRCSRCEEQLRNARKRMKKLSHVSQ
jgi:hypothetical protein